MIGSVGRIGATAQGILLILAGVLLFSTMDALAKHLTQDYHAMQVVWARYSGQTVLVALIVVRRLRSVLRTEHPWVQGLRSVMQFGATSLFFLSLAHIGLAEATAIMDLNPVLITLAAAIFLGEPIGPRRVMGVLVAMAGAMIVIRPGLGVFQPAALLPLAGAFCYAGFAVATRWIAGRDGVFTSLVYAALLGTLITSVLQPFVWRPIALGDLWAFLAIGALGALAQMCLIRAFTQAEAAVLAPFGYVGLIFAAFWGFAVFRELPDRWTVVGALVIVAAGLYVWHREAQIARRKARGQG